MRAYPWQKIFLFSVLFLAIAFAFVKIFKKDDYKYQLSVIAIFQNEDRFLKEWVDFYRVLGVEHFYLFNNLSEDDYLEVLHPYIQAGIVELYDWPYISQPGHEADWNKIQSAAYRQGLDLARGKSKWVALLDTDEFLFPKQKENLVAFLKDYEECSSLLVNWQIFGTSHVPRIPENRLMIETLLKQAPVQSEINTYCKSIVRPEKVKYCTNPHAVIHYPWSYSVDPNKKIFWWEYHKTRPVIIDKIRINHYWSRDEEFFYTNRLARHENWGNKKQGCMQRNAEANQLINEEILLWVPHIHQLQKNDPILSH
jgi:hypothetical protein